MRAAMLGLLFVALALPLRAGEGGEGKEPMITPPATPVRDWTWKDWNKFDEWRRQRERKERQDAALGAAILAGLNLSGLASYR